MAKSKEKRIIEMTARLCAAVSISSLLHAGSPEEYGMTEEQFDLLQREYEDIREKLLKDAGYGYSVAENFQIAKDYYEK